MGKAWTAIAAMVLCVSATASAQETAPPTEAYNSRASFALPPLRYTGDNIAIVIFATDVSKYCGPSPPGYRILGCQRMVQGRPVTILPNPNYTHLTALEYQRLVAHELGHRNGWTAEHPY